MAGAVAVRDLPFYLGDFPGDVLGFLLVAFRRVWRVVIEVMALLLLVARIRWLGVFLAESLMAALDGMPIQGRVVLPGRQAAMTPARFTRQLRVGAIEVGQYFADGIAQAIDIEPAKLDALVRGQGPVVAVQPTGEVAHLDVAPHPARKAAECLAATTVCTIRLAQAHPGHKRFERGFFRSVPRRGRMRGKTRGRRLPAHRVNTGRGRSATAVWGQDINGPWPRPGARYCWHRDRGP